MDAELREFLQTSDVDQGSVERLQGLLPTDDVELDGWLSDAIQHHAAKEFTILMVAAMNSGRFVDPRHLVKGARMLAEYSWMIGMAERMHGDVPEYLMEAVAQDSLTPTEKAQALYLVARWCRDRRARIYPDDLLPMAVSLAKQTTMPYAAEFCLAGVAAVTNDSTLNDFLQDYHQKTAKDGDRSWESLRAEAAADARIRLCPETLPGRLLKEKRASVISLPRNFQRRLKDLPSQVGRDTMAAIGRLAAAAEFPTEVIRPRYVEPVLIYHLWPDYALLYRHRRRRVRVINVVKRRDIAATIKALNFYGLLRHRVAQLFLWVALPIIILGSAWYWLFG